MIKVGSRVKYIHEDTEDDKASGFYPPIGTLGTITYLDKECDDSIQVKWDAGTSGDGIWWCETENVEIVEANEVEILAQKLMSLTGDEFIDVSLNEIFHIAQVVIDLGYTRKEV